jgi:hypothetical protein
VLTGSCAETRDIEVAAKAKIVERVTGDIFTMYYVGRVVDKIETFFRATCSFKAGIAWRSINVTSSWQL